MKQPVPRARLAVTRALLAVTHVLLAVSRAHLAVPRALLAVTRAHLAVTRALLAVTHALVATAPILSCAGRQPSTSLVEVTVTEGTSMAVAVSPDGASLVIDLQGTLWLVPAAGGTARAITDAFHDARQPAWSPDGRRIAFQGYRGGTYDIWVVAPDGSDLRQLTDGPYDDREPVWSPDGTRIAFASDRAGSGGYDIWLFDVRSGDVRQLTDLPGDESMPTWSPDGGSVAFASSRRGASGIRSVSVESGEERQITTTSADAPSWGPSGDIVYHRTQGGGSRLELDGQPLTGDENAFPFRASWSGPRTFYYTSDGRIRRRTLGEASSETIEFEATLAVERAQYERRARIPDDRTPRRALGIVEPTLSPDGGSVAFAALGDVWLMPIGGPPRNLTRDAHVDADPAWSPDGTMLAYSSDRAGGVLNLWLHDVRTGAARQLTDLDDAAIGAAWSPDGARVAFLEVDGAWRRAAVSVVDVATGETTRIRGSSFGPGRPTWSPDGRYVAVAALRPYASRYREGTNQILLIPSTPGTGEERWLVPDPHRSLDTRAGAGPAWSPDGSKIAIVREGGITVLPVTPAGEPSGPPVAVTTELGHAPSWSGDSRRLLYQHMDRLRMLDVETRETSDVPVQLDYAPAVPDEPLTVHAGRLIDGRSPTARTDVDIVIDGARITRVAPHAAAHHTGRRVIDATDLTVMPGLIEFHSHLQTDFGEPHGRAWLAFGITTVRSPGGTPYEAAEQREAVHAGVRIGPRIYSTGYLLEWRRAYYKMSVAIASDAHLDAELERARVLQHDLLKSYVRMPDLQQARIIRFAHEIGVPSSSHEIYPAAALGVDGVEHTTGTSRRGYSPKVATLQRSYADVPAIIGAAGMTLTPTFALSATWLNRLIEIEPQLRGDPRFALLPGWLGGAFLRPREGPEQAQPAERPTSAGPRGELVLAARRAGARIVAGTDSPNPASLHAELLAYVAAGLTPFEALQSATAVPAEALGLDAGIIEPGMLADIVIVAGNPLDDITHTHRVRFVIANGRVFERGELLER